MLTINLKNIKEEGKFLHDRGLFQEWEVAFMGRFVKVYTFERNGQTMWANQPPRDSWRYIVDDNGEQWIWDKHRIFHVGAEIEMELDPTLDAGENGEQAETIEEAREFLVDGGYIEE